MDLEGQRFSRLVVIGFYEMKRYDSANHSSTKAVWVCECDCGTTKLCNSEELKQGRVQSCGCYAREVHSNRMKLFGKTHGLTRTPEYSSYMSMLSRVASKDPHKKKYYGDIGVCDRWLGDNGLRNFIEDMGDKPTPQHQIDRIDNDGDYEPSNCRWATRSENMQNTRRAKKYKGVA